MILFVDDDKKVLSVYTKLLKIMGYHVIACNSPEEALCKARRHKDEIRAIVSDHCMPSMQGIDLIQAVGEIIPMITKVLITGFAPGVVPADITLINKPFSARTLASILERKL